VLDLIKPAQRIDTINRQLGHAVAWLIPTMALVTFGVVVLRYGFSKGAIAAQESVLYMHATAFLLGSAFTLMTDQHVRVDIFYRQFSPRGKAWVNAVGHIVFTLPVCALIGWGSVDYVADAWRIREGSPEPGGLHAVYLLKTLIPAMAVLLVLQAISETLKALALLVEVEVKAPHG
jgi:TRAP-type mannitol/chloroaromatic compound transport system permease small subunit